MRKSSVTKAAAQYGFPSFWQSARSISAELLTKRLKLGPWLATRWSSSTQCQRLAALVSLTFGKLQFPGSRPKAEAEHPPGEPPEHPGGDPDPLHLARDELQRKREAGDRSSTSSAALRYESERDAKKASMSSQFFAKKEADRRISAGLADVPASSAGPRAEDVPILDDVDFDEYVPDQVEWNPEVDDYHTPIGDERLSTIREVPEGEMVERVAKRQRVIADEEPANYVNSVKESTLNPDQAVASSHYLLEKATSCYRRNEIAFVKEDVSLKQFLFGVRRNDFSPFFRSRGRRSEEEGAQGDQAT